MCILCSPEASGNQFPYSQRKDEVYPDYPLTLDSLLSGPQQVLYRDRNQAYTTPDIMLESEGMMESRRGRPKSLDGRFNFQFSKS